MSHIRGIMSKQLLQSIGNDNLVRAVTAWGSWGELVDSCRMCAIPTIRRENGQRAVLAVELASRLESAGFVASLI